MVASDMSSPLSMHHKMTPPNRFRSPCTRSRARDESKDKRPKSEGLDHNVGSNRLFTLCDTKPCRY